METSRDCPLCGSAQNRRLLEQPRGDGTPGCWTLRRCAACGFVYLGERVAAADLAGRFEWRGSYAAEAARRRREMPATAWLSQTLRRLKGAGRPDGEPRLLRVVLRHASGGRLCDFGCGEGRLLRAAAGRFEVTGIDISAPQIAVARASLPGAALLVGPVTAQTLPRGHYDVVTLECYLEHEQDPLSALRAAFGALRSGGLLAIKVPNYASWLRRLRGRRWCGFRYPDHCNYFTPRTLRAMVERAGFAPLAGRMSDCLPTSDNMYLAARKTG